MRSLSQTGLRWLWVSVLVVIVDRLTKYGAQHYLEAYSPVRITSFFNLMLAYNKGAAFSFLGTAAGWQSWLFGLLAIIVSATLLIWLKRLPYQHPWVPVALTFIIGGAMGNLWDRVSYGHVIDFVQLHAVQLYWPVFNMADAAICVGAFMLIADSIKRKR